jgi:presqualene diphosphate synthase
MSGRSDPARAGSTAAPVTAEPAALGSSFYAAMRILPPPQREAMFQVYAFCRAVDDIADRDGPRPQRLEELGQWRARIADLYQGRDIPANLASLAAVIRRFGLEQADFDAIIDGMQMDAAADIRAPDWDTLDIYCDRVASAVGRLSVRIFEVPAEHGRPLSHHLGRALQLTNILRDLDEDAAIGRLYLPREALLEADITTTDPMAAVSDPGLSKACAPLVARARDHFAQAGAIMDRCRRAVVRSPRLMATVYRGILDELVQRGFEPPRKRVRISRSKLLLTVLRHGVL